MIIRYCYDDVAKRRYAGRYKRSLKQVAETLGLSPAEYDLRFNPGGIAVWGEVTLHTDRYYIQASRGHDDVLVRTCAGRKDYTGGRNQWVPVELLTSDPTAFAERITNLLGEK